MGLQAFWLHRWLNVYGREPWFSSEMPREDCLNVGLDTSCSAVNVTGDFAACNGDYECPL